MVPVVAANQYCIEILLRPDGTQQQQIHSANHQGKGKGGTLQSIMPTNKGIITALQNHVFDYGQGKTAEQLNKSWEKLLSYIGINYSQDLHTELTTRESISIPVPDYPPIGTMQAIRREEVVRSGFIHPEVHKIVGSCKRAT
jgi:hypothetical protein